MRRSTESEARGARVADRLLDTVVVSFAAWTLIYDLAAWTGVRAWIAFMAWLLTVPASVRLSKAAGSDAPAAPRPQPEPRLALVAIGSATACSVSVAVGDWRPGGARGAPLAWVAAGVAAAAALWAAVRAQSGAPAPQRVPPADRGERLASVMAIGLAAVSLFLVRPDADDVYFVNRSTWTAERGTFASGDTIFSDERFPAVESPQVSSIEGLIGAAANVVRVEAGSIAYLVMPPLGTMLAVLALFRLISTWRARAPALALAIALLFLLMGGATHASFGNLFLGRMWQGKVFLLSIVIPSLYVYLHRWVRDRASPAVLVATGIAAVGLSSTGVFVVPLVAAAGLSPLLAERRYARFAFGFAASSVYPVLAALVSQSTNTFGTAVRATAADVDPASVVVKVAGADVLAGFAVLAALTGSLALGSRRGRIAAATAAALTVAMLAPGALALADRVTRAGFVLWRLLWVVPVAALLGATGTMVTRGAGRIVVPLLVAGALIAGGTPLWSDTNAVSLSAPAWKVEPRALGDARAIVERSRPGDVVVAPSGVRDALAILTTRVRPAASRSDYMATLSRTPGFLARERGILAAFADGREPGRDAVERALREVRVTTACVRSGDASAAGVLRELGWRQFLVTRGVSCFRAAS